MSIQTEIERIRSNVANTYNTLEEFGADMPQTRSSDSLPGTAASVKAVLYSKVQNLSEAQKELARQNIGVGSIDEVAEEVLARLGTPVFGRVDAENNIILTGELADGVYTLKYEDADGVVTEIGTLNHIPAPTYTNLFVLDTAQINKRTNSSGNVGDNPGGFLTDFIDIGDVMSKGGTNVLHYKNMYLCTKNWRNGTYESMAFICYYDADKKFIKNESVYYTEDVLTPEGDYARTLDATCTNARYIRVTAFLLPNPSTQTQVTALTSKDQLANCKIALNETITD